MIGGGCLCGGVTFVLDGEFFFATNCHCVSCRKAHGAAFATYAHGPLCGSNPPSQHSEADHVGIPAGALDDDADVRPALHFFVAEKAPWFEITDGLVQFDGFPPGTGRWVDRTRW